MKVRSRAGTDACIAGHHRRKVAANAHQIVPNTKSKARSERYLPPNRSDNGRQSIVQGKTARKTEIVEVMAALDTCKSAAMAVSEAERYWLPAFPCSNEQITAMEAVVDLPLSPVRTCHESLRLDLPIRAPRDRSCEHDCKLHCVAA